MRTAPVRIIPPTPPSPSCRVCWCWWSFCREKISSGVQVKTEAVVKCVAALPHYDNPPKEKLHGLQMCTGTAWL